jgi:hypothetical protein
MSPVKEQAIFTSFYAKQIIFQQKNRNSDDFTSKSTHILPHFQN